MDSSHLEINSLTEAQQRAVKSRGNVLVMAGAGTGKTKTLVERCLDCIVREGAALDEILIVTFTEAAAAEMKQRLRASLEITCNLQPATRHSFAAEQLALFDAAHIGTLHGFCFKLVREHFYELGLDPQPAILDAGEARLLADETLDEVLLEQYEGGDEFAGSVQKLISIYGGGRDEKIRALVLRLHHYAQTRPDADGWFARQIENYSEPEPVVWRTRLPDAITDWRDEWMTILKDLKDENEKAAELLDILLRLGSAPARGAVGDAPVADVRREGASNRTRGARVPQFTRQAAAHVLEQIASSDSTASYPKGKAGKLRPALGSIFDEAAFLLSLAAVKNGNDPLAEDWNWVRGHMTALLRLAREFGMRFSNRKRADGLLDFHDLEQFALKLLWNFETGGPTDIARRWREKLRFVFVDEYQDINAAQDKIIQALSRDHLGCGDTSPLSTTRHVASDQSADVSAHSKANRFLVGDVKQSIYRFRSADPKIFRDYAKNWRGKDCQTIPLAENFRSRESLLSFVNSVFEPLMRVEIGGVNYDDEAKLKFGSPETRRDFSAAKDPSPRTELLLRFKAGRGEDPSDGEKGGDLADLEESEKEARLLALRLKELEKSGHKIWDDEGKVFRAAKWSDMAVLLRSPAGKADVFARQFERAGVPLAVARGGFFEGIEIQDLLSLLELLDNPLQDVPCIAVLRSPLAGCSLDELAEIRLAAKGVHFWTALVKMERGRPAREFAHHVDEPSALLLHNKISTFLERFSRWRKLARQSSLSQCLDEILAETHYGDWLRAQPRGAQRCVNVEQFLNLAQKFDQFQRQELFRFLKFIQAQREAGAEPEVAPVAEENAVRLMSIHQSKGQEFPVVAIADLAKPFNTQDLRDDVILDEEYGLCPRVKPPDRGGLYPSLTHWLAARRQRRELLGEELRLLYVAMTRARDTLILTGGIAEGKWETFWTKPAAVTPQKIAGAKCFADWLGMWFANQVQSPESGVQSREEGELPHLRWRLVADEELTGKTESGKRKAEMELPALDGTKGERLRAMLLWEYPHSAATRLAAKSSVTALRRLAGETDDEAEQIVAPKFPGKRLARTPDPPTQKRKISASEIGTAHHKFLQHFSIQGATDLQSLAVEARRLECETILSSDECAALDVEALADFWNSEAGVKIRKHGAFVKRELPFTAKFSPADLAEILGQKPEAGLEQEFVVVQGVADLAVLLPKEIWLVDFKTDAIHADELRGKIKIYAPQLKLYATALARIYSRPATRCWLHFLALRRTVEI